MHVSESIKENKWNLTLWETAFRGSAECKNCNSVTSNYWVTSRLNYTPDIQSMWGYIVFAFPFVCSFLRTYVRSFVCSFVCSSFRHRVRVFVLKFIRPHILKTLWWISFIFGMMVDIGLKFLSAPSPLRGWPWGQGHGLRIFIKSQGQSFCVKVYKTSYFEDPLMDFIHIWHVDRYKSKVFISTIPTPGVTLGSRSRT